jgi:hypothetical protein
MRAKIIKSGSLLLAILLLNLLTACNASSPTSRSEPASTVAPTAFVTSLPTNKTGATYAPPSIAKRSLEQEVRNFDHIFQAKVIVIGQLVWNSPDGKEPPDDPRTIPYRPLPEQLTPLEIAITEVYKGSLSTGKNITVLLPGAPGSKPYSSWAGFPQVGETIIWFANKEKNFRVGSNLTAPPLVSISTGQLYTLMYDGRWVSKVNNNILTIDRLKDEIKTPTPTPASTSSP